MERGEKAEDVLFTHKQHTHTEMERWTTCCFGGLVVGWPSETKDKSLAILQCVNVVQWGCGT